MASKYLAIYLNDHLAGSTGGLELVKRIAKQNAGNDLGRFAAGLRTEIEQDRETLRSIMRELGVGEDRAKTAAGWAAEKVGRLKLNGQLRGYSPLSRLIELDALTAGVSGKRSLWQVLVEVLGDDPRLEGIDFAELIARADRQLDLLEEGRIGAAPAALVD